MFLSERGTSLIVWLVVFFTIITLVLVLRFEAARIKRRSIRMDDYFILVTYISVIALDGLTYWALANGLGAHTWELAKPELIIQQKVLPHYEIEGTTPACNWLIDQLLVATSATWATATVFCKLAILWFYTCIFTTKRFKIAAWLLMVISACYGIGILCAFFTNCRPISNAWNPVPGGYCKNTEVEEITGASINMILDTTVVILPMPPLWGLQMPTRKKVAITILFGLGLLVVAVTGWRLQITVQSYTQTDYVYGLGTFTLVAHLELWFGIIVACLPTLAPLVPKYIKPAYSRFPASWKRSTVRKQTRDRKRTFGSSNTRGFKKKDFSRMDTERFLEMEEGIGGARNEAIVSSVPTADGGDKHIREAPKSIGVRHDVMIYRELQGQ